MPEKNAARAITPESRVGELLETYPQLEEVLISISPTYKALRNPVLRRTVARVATLRQVARVGNVPLAALVNRLRAEVGQGEAEMTAEAEAAAAEAPGWAAETAAARRYDARADIESGGHPMPTVMAELAKLAPGEVFMLLTPFEPAPLIDVAKQKGYAAFTRRAESDLFYTFFRKGE